MASNPTPITEFCKLNICFWNANGLRSKRAETADFLAMHRIHVLLVQETHLRPEIKLKLPGMRCYRQDRDDGYGGTAVYVSDSILHHRLYIPHTRALEATGVQISTARGPLNVFSVYIAPRRPITPGELDYLFLTPTPTIAAGDYNAKHQNWNSTCTNNRGQQLNTYVTSRALSVQTPNSPTIHYGDRRPPDWIDIALIHNLKPNVQLYTIPALSSDHYPVLLTFPSRPTFKPPRPLPSPRKTNWQDFTRILTQTQPRIDPCYTSQDVDHLVSITNSALVTAIKAASPRPTLQHYNHEPLPSGIRALIRSKNRARRRFQFSRDPQDRATFRRLQEQLRSSLTELSNQKWESHLSHLKPENGSLWKTTKALMGLPEISTPLRQGHNIAQSGKEKAEMQAAFLESTFSAADTADRDHVYQVRRQVAAFFSQPVDYANLVETSEEELESFITALPPYKAPGFDGITNAALKALPRTWVHFLAHLFNSILRTGHYPTTWKHAKVITIRKPGKDPSSPESYRPISLLPVLSKLFEKVVQARLRGVLDRNNIIRPEQFGFRASHSTVHQLLRLVDQIYTAFNRRQYVSALFLDVSRAFDSVWHDGLLLRLITSHVPSYLIHLLKSYLSRRTFSVAYEEALSASRSIRAGVPQGSVLGPSLFLLYINTLPTIPRCSLYLFADDTAITSSSTQHKMSASRIQDYADRLTTWFNQWRLRIHPQKSQAITFTKRSIADVPPIRLAGEDIQWSATVQYLGVTLDAKLTWKAHLEALSNKMSRRMALLYPLYNRKARMSLDNKLLLYRQVIRPVATYACQIWGVAARTHLRQLEVLQSRYLRSATNSPFYIPNATIHRDLHFPTVKEYIHILSKPFFRKLPHSFNTLIRGLGEYDLDPGETYKRPRLLLSS